MVWQWRWSCKGSVYFGNEDGPDKSLWVLGRRMVLQWVSVFYNEDGLQWICMFWQGGWYFNGTVCFDKEDGPSMALYVLTRRMVLQRDCMFWQGGWSFKGLHVLTRGRVFQWVCMFGNKDGPEKILYVWAMSLVLVRKNVLQFLLIFAHNLIEFKLVSRGTYSFPTSIVHAVY